MGKKVEEIITERIMDQLRQGTIPWRKPWWTAGVPRNYETDRHYNGINFFLLTMMGHADPRFITAKGAFRRGWKVAKGKNLPIVFYATKESKTQTDAKGNPRKYRILRYFNVWNMSDVDDSQSDKKIAPLPDAPTADFTPIEICEQTLKGMPNPPKIEHKGARACYAPTLDTVTMPPRNHFENPAEYYSTLFHELGHATGHKSRCGRDLEPCSMQSGSYAREELIAEMVACFVCGHCGIESKTIDNTAAYIATWLKRLGDDPKLVLRAGSKAQEGANYILNIPNEYATKDEKNAENSESELVAA